MSNVFADDDGRTIEFFTSLLARNGVDVRSVDWGSKESQALRFSVLAQVGRLDGTSVLDVGCGLGHLYDWLERHALHVDYTGLDITPGMIEAATQSHPGVRFKVGDLLADPMGASAKHDFVLASGIFYHRRHEPYRFLERTVEAMFARCNRAVAFNSLSSAAPDRDDGEFYPEPERVLTICRRISRWVTLREDYHPRDFTVYLYREAQR